MQIKAQFLMLWLAFGVSSSLFAQNSGGNFNIQFQLMAGEQALRLNTEQVYHNATGESYNFTLFNFFVSNIKLKTRSGAEYIVPQSDSYFLVRASDAASQSIQLKNVPSDDYTGISFVIGVDSLRNTMDLSERTGVLDPAFGERDGNMYWSWNSGYIFVKMEGLSAQAKADRAGNQKFRYHIGGFGGMISKSTNNLRNFSEAFVDQVATVGKGTTTTLNINVDANKLFDGPNTISIAKNTTVMSGDVSVLIANNHSSMFKVGQIVNPKAQ
ncbi:MAG TPA: hypothetical protein PLC89_25280 [Haliscomenobacter sp.]|mgnify:CR=1 FL=1|uniref:MbnP family protein n=1 Tax=Haliscomenobacter sp. TaxID=2717303 RepID=UPI002C71C5A6|nr:MbnP family protein [Haliscomenobacter sp.]HOY20649.1 hypothetical protein [Haliscomenobacter sp.]